MKQLISGTQIKNIELHDIYGNKIHIPQAKHWTHLQFRRYSGCAVCNLHLHSFIARNKELNASNIQEVVIFNSTPERILADLPNCPLNIVSDAEGHLYSEFGVGKAVMAVFNPSVWPAAIRGAAKFGIQLPRDNETSWGLPADFLIDKDGLIAAVHYGKHANDQWSIDRLLNLVALEEVAT